MKTIDVGIGHEDDFIISETIEVELVADANSKTFDQRD